MAPLPKTYSHITLASRPKAVIDPNLSTGTFKLDTHVPLRPDDVKKEQVLVKVEWLSLDPAMRGQSRLRSYAIDSGKVGALCLTRLSFERISLPVRTTYQRKRCGPQDRESERFE